MEKLDVVGHAGEVPGRRPFVARLVVVLFDIFLAERLAASDAAIHQIIAVSEADRRNADLREGEVVGAVEVASLRVRIGAVVAALFLCFRD